MIKENDIYSLIHYEYGLPYSGDYNGMRYRIARNPLERVFGKKEKGEATLETTVWKGPFAFDTTTEEKITKENNLYITTSTVYDRNKNKIIKTSK